MTKAKKNRRSLLGKISARALMLIAAVLLVLTYMSLYVNPAKAWFMTIFGLLFAPLALLNFFLLIWAIARLSKAFVIPLIALIPSIIIVGYYFQFSDGGVEDTGDGVKIVSYNVGRFASSAKSLGFETEEECADSVFTMLKAMDADIICLQEFYMKDAKKVSSYLSRNFKGYNIEYFVYPTEKGCYGNVTLSRFPILSKDKLVFDQSSNLAISCECDINGRRLRIYNCHFQSYNISMPYILKSIRGDYKGVMKYTEDKLRHSILLRPKQVDQVMKNIEESPVESIVVGDFNDNPTSYTYNRLRKGRKDSFVEAGKGFGSTFQLLQPFVRIDYILFPADCEAISHEVVRKRYSDHFPVVAKIKIDI